VWCSLWGTDWILKYYLDGLQLQRARQCYRAAKTICTLQSSRHYRLLFTNQWFSRPYSGRKITDKLRKRHSKRGKKWKEKEGSATVNSLSMYSITENIYYSQLSSFAILLQPEPNCFTSYNTSKWLCFLSLCAVVFRSPPASHVFTSNGQWSSQLFCVSVANSYTWFSNLSAHVLNWSYNNNFEVKINNKTH
jgi:hypothetical protein